ncbi:uncharacterized protein LOC143238359 [Tachypleus tridentatus]|uniref:uncharacterized protein LOC143238359 n=1 Tax=Tachypleus tridentatus TaxID=6853 RepID=UPI003FCF544E
MRPSSLRKAIFALLFVTAVATSHRSIGTLFNRLFPLVPEKCFYIWKNIHQGDVLMADGGMETSQSTKDPLLFEEKPTSNLWHVHEKHQKRNSDCMRKCIAQGILHPVQCHSLC